MYPHFLRPGHMHSKAWILSATNEDGLTIIRGQGAYSYSCVDKCRATPMVGDAPEHFGDIMTTITGKSAAAKGE